jgi:glycosyltransferase involved in cell wall biosynthesis
VKVNPQVSVVMSVYNGANSLPRTIESILNQENVDFEFIVVNDGSKDNTGKILDVYAQQDSRMRVIHQENTGLTKALIRGCAEAKGEFIARQDAGDISEPARLYCQSNVLKNNIQIALVSCWTQYMSPCNHILYEVKGSNFAIEPMKIIDLSQSYLIADGPTSHGSVMFRRDIYNMVGGYRYEFYFGQDWDLWLRMGNKGLFQTIQKFLYTQVVDVHNISSKYKNSQEKISELSRKSFLCILNGEDDKYYLAQAQEIRPTKKYRFRFFNNLIQTSAGFYYIGRCLEERSDLQAFRYYFYALSRNPINPKVFIVIIRFALKIVYSYIK